MTYDLTTGKTEFCACDQDSHSFGDAIRKARRNAGLSQSALALRCRLSIRTVVRIEAGLPSMQESRDSLLNALDLPIDRIIPSRVSEEDARIGRLLRARRRSLRISLWTVSSVLGIQTMTLSKLERGLTAPRGGWRAYVGDDLAKCLGFPSEEALRVFLEAPG